MGFIGLITFVGGLFSSQAELFSQMRIRVTLVLFSQMRNLQMSVCLAESKYLYAKLWETVLPMGVLQSSFLHHTNHNKHFSYTKRFGIVGRMNFFVFPDEKSRIKSGLRIWGNSRDDAWVVIG